ncbi:MAG TPA: arsenosugar biosynthesis radical SAM (seleno)protein ArsS [Geobacteraceae bacterium]
MVAAFTERIREINPDYVTFEGLRTVQVNLGDLCNLHCTHCHVNASDRGTRVMGRGVMESIAGCLSRREGMTLDVTGGCPEMHPDFRYLIETTAGLASRRILRSNLAIMAEPGMEWLPEFCRCHGLVITASLPCYLEENVDRQRGKGVYAASVAVLKELNRLGYGRELELNLVYNPGADFVPGAQRALEDAYRQELRERHGLAFTNLYTMTNAPIGRFREYLEARGAYERYLGLLATSFNPAAAGSIMCRTLVSVDWQGHLYNCDFNQALGLPITGDDGRPLAVDRLEEAAQEGTGLFLGQHCYCCTAGEGSSCTGALAA